MAPRLDVLSYGTIGMDVILQVPHWPSPVLSTHTRAAFETLGGKATNTAAHLATWGCSVGISGSTVGDDDMGQRLLAAVEKIQGLDIRFLGRKAGLKSMYCMILVRPDGDRAIIGVNTDSIIATPPTMEMVSSARVLTLDLYGGPERIDAARLAREVGIPVIVGDVRKFDHPVLPFTTTAICSAAELHQEYPDVSVEICAGRMLDAGPQTVIVTAGEGRILVADKAEEARYFEPPKVTPVDTTGAGDAFRAGVVYGNLMGYPALKSAMTGAAAGSLNVVRLGAAENAASLDEVLSVAVTLEPSPA